MGIAVMLVLLHGALAVGPVAAQHDDEAHGLHAAGAAAFSAGRYEEALEYFQRAYGLSHRPQVLYNIGQAADRARRDEVALDAFERYLDAVADIENRAEIEGRVRVLRAAIVAQRSPREDPAVSVVPAPDAPPGAANAISDVNTAPAAESPSPTPVGPDAGAIVLVSAGGVLAVAGAVLVILGAPEIGGARPGELIVDTHARNDRGGILVGVGAPALGLGALGVIVGIVILGAGGSDAPRSALRAVPGGAALAF